jgi:hypothetical protein
VAGLSPSQRLSTWKLRVPKGTACGRRSQAERDRYAGRSDINPFGLWLRTRFSVRRIDRVSTTTTSRRNLGGVINEYRRSA